MVIKDTVAVLNNKYAGPKRKRSRPVKYKNENIIFFIIISLLC